MKPFIVKVLDISTEHITQEDAVKLEKAAEYTENPVTPVAYSYPEGVFVYVSLEDDQEQDQMLEEAGYSSALIKIVGIARKNGCKYVQFDRDGTEYPDLETFKW